MSLFKSNVYKISLYKTNSSDIIFSQFAQFPDNIFDSSLTKYILHVTNNLEYASERLLLTQRPGFLAFGGYKFNPGPETRLDRSELLCNSFIKV